MIIDLQELARFLLIKEKQIRCRGIIGPVPPPLWIRNNVFYEVFNIGLIL
jgi:hypothetical protein